MGNVVFIRGGYPRSRGVGVGVELTVLVPERDAVRLAVVDA